MNHADLAANEREDAALLSGSEAEEFLRLALADLGTVTAWKLHTVHHRPGAGVSAGYSVKLDVGGGMREEYVIASTAGVDEFRLRETGGVTLRAGTRRLHVWLHPHDPQLPALALACDPDVVSEKLGEHSDIELIGYRPTRRAVVRIDRSAKPPLYAKVVRPAVLDELVTRLELLSRTRLPIPQLLASDQRGLVITSTLSGVPMSHLYHVGSVENARGIVGRLAGLLDALPPTVRALRRRPAWIDRCEHYADAATIALPDEADRIREVAIGVRRLESVADFGPLVPTHGDFYEANILIDPTSYEITGLLDVDNIGPGYRVNDWGCLLGHLSILPGLSQKKYGNAHDIVREWMSPISARVDPVALCASSAATVVSLIAGARKSRKKDWRSEALYRLGIAEEWVRQGDMAIDAT